MATGAALAAGAPAVIGGVFTATASGVASIVAGKSVVQDFSSEFDLPIIAYSPYVIFSNSVPAFDINFINPSVESFYMDNEGHEVEKTPGDDYSFQYENEDGETIIYANGDGDTEHNYDDVTKYESSAGILQGTVSKWYNVLRMVALVALLSILVYMAIRIIISSTASDKAKYKEMLTHWFVAMCLLFVLHYIMSFMITLSQKLTDLFSESCQETILVTLPADTTINGIKASEYPSRNLSEQGNSGDSSEVGWTTNFVGYLRFMAGTAKNVKDSFAYTVMYLICVIYCGIYTWQYLKRVVYMAFLTVMAPVIAVTYPIDKISDGHAQAFNTWFKEYTCNLLIQPVQLLIYTVVVSSIMDFTAQHPVYGLAAMGFLLPAEKLIKSMFGLDKSTVEKPGGAAAAGLVMAGVSKLLNPPGGNEKSSKNSKGSGDQSKIVFAKEKVASSTMATGESMSSTQSVPVLSSGLGSTSGYGRSYSTPVQKVRTNGKRLSSPKGTRGNTRGTSTPVKRVRANGKKLSSPKGEQGNKKKNVKRIPVRVANGPSSTPRMYTPGRVTMSSGGNSNKRGMSKRRRIFKAVGEYGKNKGKQTFFKVAKSIPGITIGAAATAAAVPWATAAALASEDYDNLFKYNSTAIGAGFLAGKKVGRNLMNSGSSTIDEIMDSYHSYETNEERNERMAKMYRNDSEKQKMFRQEFGEEDAEARMEGAIDLMRTGISEDDAMTILRKVDNPDDIKDHISILQSDGFDETQMASIMKNNAVDEAHHLRRDLGYSKSETIGTTEQVKQMYEDEWKTKFRQTDVYRQNGVKDENYIKRTEKICQGMTVNQKINVAKQAEKIDRAVFASSGQLDNRTQQLADSITRQRTKGKTVTKKQRTKIQRDALRQAEQHFDIIRQVKNLDKK